MRSASASGFVVLNVAEGHWFTSAYDSISRCALSKVEHARSNTAHWALTRAVRKWKGMSSGRGSVTAEQLARDRRECSYNGTSRPQADTPYKEGHDVDHIDPGPGAIARGRGGKHDHGHIAHANRKLHVRADAEQGRSDLASNRPAIPVSDPFPRGEPEGSGRLGLPPGLPGKANTYGRRASRDT
ncbi:hypothetical protein DL765_009667 [Monosporascus sp. GIB2]|nr:hypothetical protein DL765_009667 [Monosporascus sp. GIB2]